MSLRFMHVVAYCRISFLFAAAAAKSLQSCPTLCDPRDNRPPGSAVPGILQARTLEWVAISFLFMTMYISCFAPCIDGQLDFFHVLVIVNKGPVNMGVQISLWDPASILLGLYRSGIAVSCGDMYSIQSF